MTAPKSGGELEEFYLQSRGIENALELAEFIPVKEPAMDGNNSNSNSNYNACPHHHYHCDNMLVANRANIPAHFLHEQQQQPAVFACDIPALREDGKQMSIDPEVLASTRNLVNIVYRLPLSEHMAAHVFLESLLDKKEIETPVTKKASRLELSTENPNGESYGYTPSDLNVKSSVSAHTFDGASSYMDFTLTPSHFQYLVNDALTASVLAQEPRKQESFDSKSRFHLVDTADNSSTLTTATTSTAATQKAPHPHSRSHHVCRHYCSDESTPFGQMIAPIRHGAGRSRSTLCSNDTSSNKSNNNDDDDDEEEEEAKGCSYFGDNEVMCAFTNYRFCAEPSQEAPLIGKGVGETELNAVREGCLLYEPFSRFEGIQIECIIRSMKRVSLITDELYTLQDELLFVYSGTLLVEKGNNDYGGGDSDNMRIEKLTKGNFFGTLNILNEHKESLIHHLRALTNSVLFCIHKYDFQSLLYNEKGAYRTMFVKMMRESEVISVLSLKKCKRVADSLRVCSFEAGSVLMRKAQPMEWFSFIISGTVKRILHKEGEGEEEMKMFTEMMAKEAKQQVTEENYDSLLEIKKQGDIVGDFELFFRTPLLTDIVAETKVLVAQMHIVYFRMILPSYDFDKMKQIILKSPLLPWFLAQSPDVVCDEVITMQEQQQETRSHSRRKSAFKEGIMNRTPSRMVSYCSNCGVEGVDNNERKGNLKLKNKKIRSSGEIVYAGKNNFYRFPLSAMNISNIIIIALVADGVIIRWNPVAESVTGYKSHHVLGQRIYDLLGTETARHRLKEQLYQVRKFPGGWEDYVASGLSTPCAYRFRQSTELYHVNLMLTVVPSCLDGCRDVMLLVGREADNHAVSNYVEDAVRWMQDVLQPQLNAFQKRVESLEKKNWAISPEDGRRLLGHLETCNKLMERYMRVSNLNLESMNEMWKPARIHHVMRQFVREIVPHVNHAKNKLTLTFEEEVPKREMFFDVEHVLEILRKLIKDINKTEKYIHISMTLSVIDPPSTVSPGMILRDSSCPFNLSRRASLVSHSGPPPGLSSPQSAPSCNSTPVLSVVSNVPVASKEDVRLCSASQLLHVIDSSAPFSMRRLRIVVTDNVVECEKEEEEYKESSALKEGEHANFPCKEGGEKTSSYKRHNKWDRMITIKECERIVSSMGGSLSFYNSEDASTSNKISIELPLLPVPWEEGDENNCHNNNDSENNNNNPHPIVSRPFSVIVADRDAKQRGFLCHLMWSRHHAVVPVTSFRDAINKVASGGAEILVIDPLYLDATEEEYEALRHGKHPFDVLAQQTHLVVLLYADDLNDWRVKKLMRYCHVIELPKPASAALLHFAMHEAERVVTCMREDEEQIALLRMAFTELQKDRHKVGRVLGKGAFGEVFEVEDLLTGGKLAMKRMYLKDGMLADDTVQELVAMTSLRHENIIHYFYCQQESDTHLCLYMELASQGTLQDKIKKHGGPLPLEEIIQHLQDLSRGLVYLHSKNYIHGDIKPANALIDHHGRTKIGDFGTATRLKRSSDKLYITNGTPQFMAPEVMNVDSTQSMGYNQKADIWSLGCVALEMATGMVPFYYLPCTHGMGIWSYISNLTDTPDLSFIKDIHPPLYAFIESCLCIHPEKRPSAEDLLQHELLQGAEYNSGNERTVRNMEMVETLIHYAALESGEDVDEEEEEEDNSNNNDNDNNNNDISNNSNSSLNAYIDKRRREYASSRGDTAAEGNKEVGWGWPGWGEQQYTVVKEQVFFESSNSSSCEKD